MKCHGTSLHGQGEYEPEKKDLGESDQRLDLSKTSKARSRNVLLTQLCLIKGREVRIWNGRDFIQRICKSRWSHGDCHDEIFSDCRWFLWPFLQRTIICIEQDRSSTKMHNVRKDLFGSQRIQLALSIVHGQVIGAGFYGVVNGPCPSWSIEKLLQSLLASTLHD